MIATGLHVLLGAGFISVATVDSHSSTSQTNSVGPIFQSRNDTNMTVAIVAQMDEQNSAICGWIGVQVRPMTAKFAASLGMVEPYGAIFDQPEAGSPAAKAGIEAGDVITAINGLPLMRSSDFARMLAANAPGTSVYLSTWRSGMFVRIRITLGSSKCGDERQEARTQGVTLIVHGSMTDYWLCRRMAYRSDAPVLRPKAAPGRFESVGFPKGCE